MAYQTSLGILPRLVSITTQCATSPPAHPLLSALGVRKCFALASTFSCQRVYQPTLCTNCKGFCFPPPLVSPFADAIDAPRINRYSVAMLLTTPVGCTNQASVYCRGLFPLQRNARRRRRTPSFVCARRSQMLRACSRLPLPTGVPHLNNANSGQSESALFFVRDCFGIKFSLRQSTHLPAVPPAAPTV